MSIEWEVAEENRRRRNLHDQMNRIETMLLSLVSDHLREGMIEARKADIRWSNAIFGEVVGKANAKAGAVVVVGQDAEGGAK